MALVALSLVILRQVAGFQVMDYINYLYLVSRCFVGGLW